MVKGFFKSIRVKAFIWYVALLFVILLSFSTVIYGVFVKELYDDLDDLLSSRSEGVADSVRTYWHTKRVELHEQGKKLDISEAKYKEDFAGTASGLVKEKRNDPDLMNVFVRIIDSNGKEIASSKNMPVLESIDKKDFEDVLKGEEDFSTVNSDMHDGKGTKFRLYTKPVIDEGKISYIVQVAGPLALLSIALNNLKFVLFIILPLAVLLAAIPGVILIRLTLHPIDKMIGTLKEITAENLKLRIHMPDTKDEIKRLADTFNDMIERLDRSFTSQHKFIQSISSELQGPMKGLKDELEATVGKNFKEEEYRLLITKAAGEMNRYSKIMENLMVFSMFDANESVLEIRKVDIGQLVREVLEDFKIKADKKEIEVLSEIPENGKIMLDGDCGRLIRLFANLFDNAVKYTYRNGKIFISVELAGPMVNINVRDTGMGIEKEELPYIFDRFYQAAKPRASKDSFGIGLTIVKSIVDAHQGMIKVDSELGKGSAFTISLPLSYQG